MSLWIGTRIGPAYVGRSLRGEAPEPKSPFTRAVWPIWGVLLLITFFVAPFVTAVLLLGAFPLLLACAVAETRHGKPRKVKDPGRVMRAGLPGFYEEQAQRLRLQHLAGRKVTNRARHIIERRPDLEYVIFPERRPVDPYQFFTPEDWQWAAQYTGDDLG
jgi:hypothetical protein